MSAALHRSVASLSIPNYRRFFVGQLVSVSGKWVQNVAAVWLVLHLSGSGTAVGLTTAAEFLPMLLLGAWGGLLADRLPKRPLLLVTQTLQVLSPFVLFFVVVAGAAQTWMVIASVAVSYAARYAAREDHRDRSTAGSSGVVDPNSWQISVAPSGAEPLSRSTGASTTGVRTPPRVFPTSSVS